MKKIVIIPLILFAAACSGKPKEPEVLKIFSLHSYEEHAPQKISALLGSDGVAGLAKLDSRAAVLEKKRPLKARPTVGIGSAGMLLGERNGGLVLLKVFERSPAAGAGLREGDKLLALDGEPLTPESAARLLAGKVNFTDRKSVV